jgi:hypothetical protein
MINSTRMARPDRRRADSRRDAVDCARRFICKLEDSAQRTFDERFEAIDRGGARERPLAFLTDLQRGRATRTRGGRPRGCPSTSCDWQSTGAVWPMRHGRTARSPRRHRRVFGEKKPRVCDGFLRP